MSVTTAIVKGAQMYLIAFIMSMAVAAMILGIFKLVRKINNKS
jgi:hypothetical protein